MKTRMIIKMVAFTFPVLLFCGNMTAVGKNSTIASSLENATDPMLQIEDWMMNDNCWIGTGAVEPALGIESWMTDESMWYSEITGTLNTAEQKIMIEPWMTDEKNWSRNQVIIHNETDGILEVESWMTKDAYWKLPVKQ